MTISGSTATELLASMEAGELSSVDVTRHFLGQIEAQDDTIGAFLFVNPEASLEQAKAIDAKRAAGQPVGLLGGLPVAIKDVLCMRDTPTTCGSRMLDGFRPPYDSTVVERLKAADAIIIGKTNMDEFAMGSSTENSAYKLTRNPWNTSHAPGGSSGGSAACVAAGMAPLSIGTDTGGSIRQPAAFCGVVGMKPTYGRVSRYGLIAYASSLDQAGPLANDVTGAAKLLQVIAGHDARDSTSVDQLTPDYMATLDQPLQGLKIGIATEHFVEGLHPEVESAIRAAIEVYNGLGARVIDVSLPHSKYAVATYYLIAPSEASSNLARYDGVHYGHRAESFSNMVDMYCTTRGEGFGEEVKRRIMLGVFALSEGYSDQYYLKALQVRRLIREDFDKAFANVDVILAPVAPTPAFKIGELVDDPLSMYLTDIYTISGNLAGIPCVSIPAGFSRGGLPIGMQLYGPAFSEDRLLRAARMFEKESTIETPALPVRSR